ncbi:PorV/PorQ family protein [Candidatus Marinimicrobia bacterium]|nr:PorV/PorQ family protein [Candidatus Neomarinimicrobiota bacterium]MDB3980092.1 PorV/PorQ family protein [Candidatus Neomarinimicrobiota bacterium]MDC0594115.1 PorV/PorQ family protein [Candidatus Neomarinimicrobiota bacterium]
MKYKNLIATVILLSQLVMAQGQAGSLFLSINPGARANGMGEAQIGIANDAYATYYNPAGLSNLSNTQASFMHTSYLPNLVDDMAYDFITFATPFREDEAIGGHFTYLNLGDQISTDANGAELGSFSSYMYALNLSYSKKIDEDSSWGLNGKYFYQELAVISSLDASSSSVAFDVGYFKRNAMDNPNLTMGAVLTNVGPGVSFGDGEEDPLPTKLGLGLGYLALEGKANLAFDLNYEVNDQSMVTNLGVEYYLVEDFALRAGIMNDPSGDLSYTTLGLGARIDALGFDVSYIMGGELDPHSNMVRFSLSGSF